MNSCTVCGAEFTSGLKYCKRCGSSLNRRSKTNKSEIKVGEFANMFWAIAVFGLSGLALLTGGVLGVLGMGIRSDAIVLVSVFILVTILAVVGMLTRQLSRLIKITEDAQTYSQIEKEEITGEPDYPRIAEPPDSMPSVTEHTTRNMEPSRYKKQSVRE